MARKRNKKWINEVDEEYLRKSASLSPLHKQDYLKAIRQQNRMEARLKYRAYELRRGLRYQNGDKWGNTWLRRKRFLEGKIERSERKIRVRRLLSGQTQYVGSWTGRLGAVRSAAWPSVLRYLASRILKALPGISTKSVPAGKGEIP